MNGEKLAINEVKKTVLIEFMDARGIGFLTGFWAGWEKREEIVVEARCGLEYY